MTDGGLGPEPPANGLITVAGGAVFLVTGASLVVHILTGAPLWALLAGLVVVAFVAVSRLVLPSPRRRVEWADRCRVGTVLGLAATAAYDGARWLLVEVAGFHTSPFTALPLFGDALLGNLGDPALRTAAGIAFHLTNGITFGIAYTVWFGDRSAFWGVPFAFGLEAFMLALYPGWLDVRSVRELTEISVLGHLVYGLVLGGGAALGRQRMGGADGQRRAASGTDPQVHAAPEGQRPA